MNSSTAGVTLYYGFILDLLRAYESSSTTFARGLFEMAPKLPSENPTQLVPIELYNGMCDWIESNIGGASLRKAGITIGARAYDQMVAGGVLGASPTPLEIMEGLKRVASEMIQDPEGRGWSVLRSTSTSITMRRTQTFNCLLQEGLLRSLVAKSGVGAVDAQHVTCVRNDAAFCDYIITWLA